MPKDIRAGYEVYHREMGKGAREALMLHCSLAHSGAWRGVSAELDDVLRIVAPDHLCHGQSADWDARGDYGDDSTAVAKSFLREAPVDIVGHSFGACVALRVALEAPEKVRSLVLIEPVLFSVTRAVSKQSEDAYLAETAVMNEALRRGDRQGAAKAFINAWGDGQGWDNLPEPARDAMAAQIHIVPASQPMLFDDSASLLEAGRLEALECPVLLLRGGRSPDVMRTIVEGLETRLPNAQSQVVPDAGHMLPITHSKETATAMRAFWGL